jgi:ABC-2 family transporter protein
MRAFLAVCEREVVERRLLVAASLLLGLVPLAAPWIPGLAQRGGPELRSATALVVALCFSFGLALILGASIVAGDLAERRLGFYFSRPIPGWAVWAGKLAAAAVLSLCVGALILLPSFLLERRFQLGGWWNDPFSGNPVSALLWVAAVLLLVALGHAASVALRSRSPWLLLDFAGLGATAWLAWVAVRRLAFQGAVGAANLATAGLLALLLTALIAAGAVQVLAGRTDLRRGHRLLSFTLWGALLAGTLAAQGYASWALAVEPQDLDHIGVAAMAPRGSWIAMYGEARHRAGYQPSFLLDVSSERFVRVLALPPDFGTSPWFSADGRWALWLEPQGSAAWRGPLELLRLDLRDPRQRPERTRIAYARPPSLLAVSADGSRIAVAAGRRLTVEEVPSGRLLASAELPRPLGRYRDSMLFVGSGRVRIFGSDLLSDVDPALRSALEVGEMRLSGGGLVRTARIEGAEMADVSPDGASILARRGERCFVLDAGTGAVLAELPVARRSRAAFLADGRIALVAGGRDKELRIFSRDFAPERSFRFAGGYLHLGGQPASDQLIVAAAPRVPGSVQWGRSQVLLLDLATGSMRRLGRGLVPAAGPDVGPQSAGSTLFWRGEGSRLVRLEPRTGKESAIAGRRAG